MPAMDPITEVHGSTFTKAAGEFVVEHEDLGGDTRRILDAIAALGDFAGTDETANTFRRGYNDALAKTETYVNALRDAYPAIAYRLAGMRTSFDVANWATIESLPRVSDPPEYSKSDRKFIPQSMET
ncbi:hypothetical protein GCM10022224_033090 [Nonomuraea antimicrobica]|uniref:Excreted virulence factor EspC, type VII ESX diderm n=1 Tax=Nonomuraea antimicrobica TaxID=561173 RepID=A0ABP7BPC7_9ACTN